MPEDKRTRTCYKHRLCDPAVLRACQTVAIYGGSFDPPHVGHVTITEFILREKLADHVILLPAPVAPHKLHAPPVHPYHRLNMLALAFEDIAEASIATYEIERPPPCYTIDSLNHFRNMMNCRTRFVMGMDSLRDLHLWYQARRLVETFDFIIYPRPGVAPPSFAELATHFGDEGAEKLTGAILWDAPLVSASSSAIRNQIRQRPNFRPDLLSDAVWHYIRDNGIYSDAQPGNAPEKKETPKTHYGS